MKKFMLLLVTLVIMYSQQSIAQIGSTISSDRKVDWSNVGYNSNPDDNLPTGSTTIQVQDDTTDPATNWSRIESALNSAAAISNSSNIVVVQFQSGTYNIDQPIVIEESRSNIILRGSGNLNTTIYYEGTSGERSDIIKIFGSKSNSSSTISNYSPTNKRLTVYGSHGIQADDVIDIQVGDGSWLDTPPYSDGSIKNESWLESDFLGQVVKVESVNGNYIYLEDDISIIYDLSQDEEVSIYFKKINPVIDVGIENLKIYSDSNSDQQGRNIWMKYAYNCWINEIESEFTHSSHVSLWYSTKIEIRDSYFHNSHYFGGGGKGYGVEMLYRTTNSLVENNVFSTLRHAMIVAVGANKNVYGFNFSTKQTDTIGNIRGDINLHGHFPFANLFEGNRVDRIHADYFWGTNGPYNTFFRNFITTAEFWIENSLYTNALGNEGLLVTFDYSYDGVYDSNYDSQENTLSVYGNALAQHKWKPKKEEIIYLNDVSYYHTSKPGFLGSYSWPSLGPPTQIGSITTQNIPARQSYCNSNSCQGVRHSAWFNTDDLVVFREVGSGNSQINKLAFVNATGTTLSGFGEYVHGSGEMIDITGGDFDGDGLDDIAIAKVDNKIWVRASVGSGFISKTSFTNDFGSSIGSLTNGDFNGDGLKDLAYTTEGNYTGIKSRIAVYFSDAEKIIMDPTIINFVDSIHFDLGGYDFHGLTSGDYDGDGKDDIAFFRKGTSSALNWILAYKVNENGTFTKIIDFQMGGYDFKGMASGDFNADGKDDLVIYRRGSGGISTENWIITYTKNGSSLSLINSFYESGWYDLKGITTGDYDNDGIDDIGVFRRGSTSTENFINTYTSNKTSFSEYEDFSYGGYDFNGITSGRFFHGGSNFKLNSGNSNKESKTNFKSIRLLQNYPNPFNPTTNINFVLPVQSDVSLKIYDLLGREVAELVNGKREAGEYSFQFDASRLSSGIYIYQLRTGNDIIIRKMTLIK